MSFRVRSTKRSEVFFGQATQSLVPPWHTSIIHSDAASDSARADELQTKVVPESERAELYARRQRVDERLDAPNRVDVPKTTTQTKAEALCQRFHWLLAADALGARPRRASSE